MKLFERAVTQAYPQFVTTRIKEPVLPGGVVLEWAASDKTKVWLAFGGFKDSAIEFGLYGAWTKEGHKYSEIEHDDEQDARKSSGVVDLRDREVLSGSSKGPFVALSVEPPSIDLQEEVLGKYLSSPEYQRHLDKIEASELRRKNPDSRAKLHELYTSSERATLRLWSHLLDRCPEADSSLEHAVQPVVAKALDLLDGYGMGFLTSRTE
ncbi:MAG TPA: hypothetical protein VK961_03150 [Chthoniobacter sp.]|nr:hypothetical protein [Chthoniobacter sp.]